MYEERAYRKVTGPQDLHCYEVVYKETDLLSNRVYVVYLAQLHRYGVVEQVRAARGSTSAPTGEHLPRMSPSRITTTATGAAKTDLVLQPLLRPQGTHDTGTRSPVCGLLRTGNGRTLLGRGHGWVAVVDHDRG